jgi:flavin reductase (DIM6/NTAB) family NADH-FMN oxidoreductase RutF
MARILAEGPARTLRIVPKRSRPRPRKLRPMSRANDFVTISPEILYFGTPVAVVSSLNPDGTTNLAAMSSFWALGERFMLGITRFGQTWANLERHPECVLNMPSPEEWPCVERLGHTTGRAQLTDYHRRAGITCAHDKFAVSGFTPMASERVAPVRVAECPVQIEARILAMHSATDDASFVYIEVRKLLVHAQRRVLDPSARRFDVEAWSPLFYVFRHYYGKGTHLGTSFRAQESRRAAPELPLFPAGGLRARGGE